MISHERRLLTRTEVAAVLQLANDQIQWLVSTEQIRPIRICNEERFDSRDVFQLVEAYKTTQGRKQ